VQLGQVDAPRDEEPPPDHRRHPFQADPQLDDGPAAKQGGLQARPHIPRSVANASDDGVGPDQVGPTRVDVPRREDCHVRFCESRRLALSPRVTPDHLFRVCSDQPLQATGCESALGDC
jgi:hypothetical protein